MRWGNDVCLFLLSWSGFLSYRADCCVSCQRRPPIAGVSGCHSGSAKLNDRLGGFFAVTMLFITERPSGPEGHRAFDWPVYWRCCRRASAFADRTNQLMPVAFPRDIPSADPDGSSQPLPSLADMLERVNPAVVNIATRSVVRESNRLLEDPFFRRFFNVPKSRQRYRRTQSAGSGVVIDAAAGYIVTNAHVVKNADEISIGVSDGRTLEATLIGIDPEVDLALLQVPAEDLIDIDYADSARLRVGDFVVAIGNPFGLNQTVTSGIISALGRSGLGIEGYEDFIQTDASINPGNSGGALVDLNGRLVGINTAIFAPSGGNIGIGFAIPANMVSAVAAQLIAKGEINRGFVGAIVQPLNRELAKAFGVISGEGVPQGVVVVDVQGGSSAEQAGLEPGDVIVQMRGNPIVNVADFSAQAAVMFIGDEVDVRYVRQGEKRQTTMRIIADQQQAIAGKVWRRGCRVYSCRTCAKTANSCPARAW